MSRPKAAQANVPVWARPAAMALLLSESAGALSARKGLESIKHGRRALPDLECNASRKPCAWLPVLAMCAVRDGFQYLSVHF